MKAKNSNQAYPNTLRYLKKTSVFAIITFIAFITVAILSFLIAGFIPDSISMKILEYFQNLIEQTKGMNFLQLFFFILQNNLKASFIGMILGIFLGIYPIVVLVVNSFVIGFVSYEVTQISGPYQILKLLPHGIFEIPALIISIAIGIKLGLFFLQSKEKLKAFFAQLLMAASFLFFSVILIAILLIMFAAISSMPFSLNQEIIQNTLNTFMQDKLFSLVLNIAVITLFILTIYICSFIFSENDRKAFLHELENSLKTFIFIVVPLLIIAAIIESLLIVFSA